MDEYIESMKEDFAKALDAFRKELAKVRTGRASPQLVDGLQVVVQSYGATMPLNQLATVQAPDARLLVITPWDKGTLGDIEKAILASGLGLTPSNDGKLIRLPVPPLTQERRQQLVKMVKGIGEDAKVRIRHVRRDYNETFKQAEADGECTQDELDRLLEQVQKATDDAVARVDDEVGKKEKEVLDV